MLDPIVQQQIRALHSMGRTISQISRDLSVSWNTVHRYVNDNNHGRRIQDAANPRRKPSLAAANQDTLKETLKGYRYVAAMLSHDINKNPEKFGLPEGFKISSRAVRTYVSRYLVPKDMDSVAAKLINDFDVAVGQQLQIDFTHAEYIFSGNDEPTRLVVFEAVYSWSHKQYFWIAPDMSQSSWLRGLAMCILENGCPVEILCDNDKCLVIQNRGKNGVYFHPDFVWFCKNFEVVPRACKPSRPQTKGRVERAGGYLKSNGLVWIKHNYPELSTIEQLNAAVERWVKETSDERVFRDTIVDGVVGNYTVRELFEYESKFLITCNRALFGIPLTWEAMRVRSDGLLYLHGHKVTLPSKYRNQQVNVIVFTEGHYRISDIYGRVLEDGYIQKENLSKYRLDYVPEDGLSGQSSSTEAEENTDNADDNLFMSGINDVLSEFKGVTDE